MKKLASILICMYAFAIGVKAQVYSDTVLLVTGHWPPYTNEERPNEGLFTELVCHIFDEMKVPYKLSYYPWKRCEKMLEQGRAFAAFPYAFTNDWKSRFVYSDPVVVFHEVLFYYDRKKEGFYKNGKLDLTSNRVVGIPGYNHVIRFREQGIDFDLTDSEMEALTKLKNNRVDLVPLFYLNGWALIEEYFPDEKDKFGILDSNSFDSEAHLIVSKSYPGSMKLLKLFNQKLEELLKSGDLNQWTEKLEIE